jgi:sugar phosphate isomerase/epimerase
MNHEPDSPPATIVLHLHVKPGNWCVPWDIRLRAALKRLGRDYGLRCSVCKPLSGNEAGEPKKEQKHER